MYEAIEHWKQYKKEKQIKLNNMSKIKLVYNKAYNYVKSRSIIELSFEALTAFLFLTFIVGFTNLIGHLIFSNPVITFGGW